MRTEVTFCVDLGQDCVKADTLQREFADYQSQLEAEFPQYGELILRNDGSGEIRVRDELAAAVQGICFSSIPQIASGKEYVYTYFSASGRLVFIPSTVFVEVIGDQVKPAKFRRDTLLPALYQTGNDYLSLIEKLESEDQRATAAELGKHRSPAEEALKALR